MSRLPKVVLALGAVSFLGDVSSEMIFPLLPTFVTTYLGAGPIALGLIEGAADATSSLLKLFSGVYSDRTHNRKTWVTSGYGLSALTRPFLSLANSWPALLCLRFSDRVGKGVRSSPRDALIADSTQESQRGRAFGFHQAADHAGAVLGPLVAMALLSLPGFDLRKLFLAASVPALFTIPILLFGVKEPARSTSKPKFKLSGGLSPYDSNFLKYLFVSTLFTLGNSSDAFLLMLLGKRGVATTQLALLWSVQHIVRMLGNYFGGIAVDKFGGKKLLVLGWVVYALTYVGFAAFHSPTVTVALFLFYGLYYGAAEPSQKVLVTDLSPSSLRASAFGWFNFTTGLAVLPASVGFGWLWQEFGDDVAFGTGAAIGLAAAIGLTFVKGKASGNPGSPTPA